MPLGGYFKLTWVSRNRDLEIADSSVLGAQEHVLA